VIRSLLMTCAALLAAPALAFDPALAPMVNNGTVAPRDHAAVHRALDEALEIVGLPVIRFERYPDELTLACLEQSTCLAGIASSVGTDRVIAGAIREGRRDGTVELELRHFDIDRGTDRVRTTFPADDPDERVRAAIAELFDVNEAYLPRVAEEAPPEGAPSSGPAEAAEPERDRKAERREAKNETDRSASRGFSRRPPGDRSRWMATGRLGWTRYYVLEFMTFDAEMRFHAADGLYVVAGVELYVANRLLDDDQGEQRRRVNAMVPVHAGALYGTHLGRLEAYVGGDVIAAKYNADAGAVSVGVRARAGADVMITDDWGVNLDVSAGLWGAKGWPVIEEDVRQVGLLPRLSGGVAYVF